MDSGAREEACNTSQPKGERETVQDGPALYSIDGIVLQEAAQDSCATDVLVVREIREQPRR